MKNWLIELLGGITWEEHKQLRKTCVNYMNFVDTLCVHGKASWAGDRYMKVNKRDESGRFVK